MISKDYTVFTLSNGLRIVHAFDEATSMVALSVLYDTGARDEKPERTGLAHLMEHLMFGGSINIPEFDTAIQNAGGVDNAWTSNDFTCFYDLVPAHNVETAFWLESDRMISLAFNEKSLETQRKVVIEEFHQQCLNRPYGKVSHEIRRLAYPEHPYGWPVIGKTPEHIAAVDLEEVKNFYFNHYSPSNAVVAVVGNISLEHTEQLARKWFDNVPDRKVTPRVLPPVNPINELRSSTVYDNVPTALISINFLMEPYGTKGYITADLLSDVLSSGRSARFHKNLVIGTELFDSVDASITGSEHQGLFNISAVLRENVGHEVAEKAIFDDLQSFLSEQLKQEDLQRALNRFESARIFDNLGPVARSQNLAMAVMHNENPDEILQRYRETTTDDIIACARQLIDPQRAVIVHCLPDVGSVS